MLSHFIPFHYRIKKNLSENSKADVKVSLHLYINSKRGIYSGKLILTCMLIFYAFGMSAK